MRRRIIRGLTGTFVTAGLLGLSAAQGHSAGTGMAVAIVSVPGYAGHAFVYAQVTDATAAYPAPTGTTHQSPYYSRWTRQPITSSACPWIWAIYVFDRATNLQINVPTPSAPQPNFGTTNSFCASPSTTPVEEPSITDAAARLDLDLQVGLSPPQPIAGTSALLSARLTSTLTQDLNLYLNMAIEEWSVTRWLVDFGDGSTTAVSKQTSDRLNLPHTYSSAGLYDARVIAVIGGRAQAARYDRYGTVHLVEQPFSVEVGNHTSATSRAGPARTYVPPQAEVTVSPALDGSTVGVASFRHVDVLRGALTTFALHLRVTREAFGPDWCDACGRRSIPASPMEIQRFAVRRTTRNGVQDRAPWRTRPTPLRLQWNQPDRISGHQPQDYAVPLSLYVECRFHDGQ